MCLSIITKKYEQPDMTERDAYKVFKMAPVSREHHVYGMPGPEMGFLYTEYQGSAVVPFGSWLKAELGKPRLGLATPIIEYTPGFHVFTYYSNAVSYARHLRGEAELEAKVVKVKVRGVHTEGHEWTSIVGYENDATVLVADEMFVPRI